MCDQWTAIKLFLVLGFSWLLWTVCVFSPAHWLCVCPTSLGVGSKGESPSVLCSSSQRCTGQDDCQGPQPLRRSGGMRCHRAGKRSVCTCAWARRVLGRLHRVPMTLQKATLYDMDPMKMGRTWSLCQPTQLPSGLKAVTSSRTCLTARHRTTVLGPRPEISPRFSRRVSLASGTAQNCTACSRP